jgi:hypothetical protein
MDCFARIGVLHRAAKVAGRIRFGPVLFSISRKTERNYAEVSDISGPTVGLMAG